VLSEEVKIKNDQYDRLTKLEEQTPVLNKELECIRKELGDKTTELNVAREKLENIIRSEQVIRLVDPIY
jgi:regulator of replication initiation timing